MTINAAGLELIQDFESCRLEAYQDSIGRWTLGYGRTQGIIPGMTCTQQEADEWFEDDINFVAARLSHILPTTLTENQYSACVSLAYNIGVARFRQTEMLVLLKAGAFQSAADEFLKFNHAGGHVVDGLTRRRKAERELFLTA